MAGELDALRKTASEHAALVEDREAAFVANVARVASATTETASGPANPRRSSAVPDGRIAG